VFVTDSIRASSTSWSFLFLGDLRVTIIGGMLAATTFGALCTPMRERRVTPRS
jgi:hypothetical protein